MNDTMSDVVYFFKILTKDTKGVLDMDKFGKNNKRINCNMNKDCFIFYFFYF